MSASLHDPKHAYWCAVPWCPQYVRNHDGHAASPSGPSPATGLDPERLLSFGDRDDGSIFVNADADGTFNFPDDVRAARAALGDG